MGSGGQASARPAGKGRLKPFGYERGTTPPYRRVPPTHASPPQHEGRHGPGDALPNPRQTQATIRILQFIYTPQGTLTTNIQHAHYKKQCDYQGCGYPLTFIVKKKHA